MPVYKTSAAVDSPALLILDIDETLLHASIHNLDRPCDYKAERTWVYKRPYVDEFLHYCHEFFQIAVWTSARASFAEEIFSQVFPYLSLQFIHSQQHCLTIVDEHNQETSIKPINTLNQLGFDLKRVLVIDDSPEKHCLNPDNLIPVRPYRAEEDDDELHLLKKYLHHIKEQENFLALHKYHWRHFTGSFERDLL
jgi:RNA polymerase II subunit A small phosphatase-like protein